MLTLFRGGSGLWMSPQDAETLDVHDNDWVEAHNRNGIVVVGCWGWVRVTDELDTGARISWAVKRPGSAADLQAPAIRALRPL
jgi:nitrate reductase alpha subunit